MGRQVSNLRSMFCHINGSVKPRSNQENCQNNEWGLIIFFLLFRTFNISLAGNSSQAIFILPMTNRMSNMFLANWRLNYIRHPMDIIKIEFPWTYFSIFYHLTSLHLFLLILQLYTYFVKLAHVNAEQQYMEMEEVHNLIYGYIVWFEFEDWNEVYRHKLPEKKK